MVRPHTHDSGNDLCHIHTREDHSPPTNRIVCPLPARPPPSGSSSGGPGYPGSTTRNNGGTVSATSGNDKRPSTAGWRSRAVVSSCISRGAFSSARSSRSISPRTVASLRFPDGFPSISGPDERFRLPWIVPSGGRRPSGFRENPCSVQNRSSQARSQLPEGVGRSRPPCDRTSGAGGTSSPPGTAGVISAGTEAMLVVERDGTKVCWPAP